MSGHDLAISIGCGLGAALATVIGRLLDRRKQKQLSAVDAQQETRLVNLEGRLSALEQKGK